MQNRTHEAVTEFVTGAVQLLLPGQDRSGEEREDVLIIVVSGLVLIGVCVLNMAAMVLFYCACRQKEQQRSLDILATGLATEFDTDIEEELACEAVDREHRQDGKSGTMYIG